MNIPIECYPAGYFTGPADREASPCALCGDYFHVVDMIWEQTDYICKPCLKNEEDECEV